MFKDLALLNSIFFYLHSLERYVLAIVVIFCSHCLTPLEAELVDNAEVFMGNLQASAMFLFGLGAVGALTCLYGVLGAMAVALNRPRLGEAWALAVLVVLTNAWVTVG